MAAVAFIKALVLKKNNKLYPEGKELQIPVSNASLDGEFYFRPQSNNDTIHTGYDKHIASVGETIGADEVRVLRITDLDRGDVYYIVPASGVTLDDVANVINGTGSTDLTTSASIPTVIAEMTVPIDEDTGEYTYTFPFPPNPFGRKFDLALTYNNGQVPGAAYTVGGYANEAAVVTWLNANMAAGGANVWSLVTSGSLKLLKLVSTVITSIDVDLSVQDATFCLVVPIPGSAVTIGIVTVKNAANADTNVDVTPFSLHNGNEGAVLAAVRSVLGSGTVTWVHMGGTDYRLSYTGQMKPVALKSPDGTTTTVAWTAGVCA